MLGYEHMTRIILASGPVIVEDGKALLVQHGDTPFWKFCGGRVETFFGSLIDHAKREAKEEVGIDLEILDPTPFLFYTKKQTSDGDVDVILVHYLAHRLGEIVPGPDIRACEWIALDDLARHELGPNILPTLKHFGYV